MEHTDSDFDVPHQVLNPTGAKKKFKTHFEAINERIEKMRIQMGK